MSIGYNDFGPSDQGSSPEDAISPADQRQPGAASARPRWPGAAAAGEQQSPPATPSSQGQRTLARAGRRQPARAGDGGWQPESATDIANYEDTPNPGSREPRDRADGSQRRVTIRLDLRRYMLLESLAEEDGLTPTTMARLLLIRGLRRAELDLDLSKYPEGG